MPVGFDDAACQKDRETEDENKHVQFVGDRAVKAEKGTGQIGAG